MIELTEWRNAYLQSNGCSVIGVIAKDNPKYHITFVGGDELPDWSTGNEPLQRIRRNDTEVTYIDEVLTITNVFATVTINVPVHPQLTDGFNTVLKVLDTFPHPDHNRYNSKYKPVLADILPTTRPVQAEDGTTVILDDDDYIVAIVNQRNAIAIKVGRYQGTPVAAIDGDYRLSIYRYPTDLTLNDLPIVPDIIQEHY